MPQTLSPSFTAASNGNRKTPQRRSRGLMIEERRVQAKWWRMAAPLSQCACFRRKPLERQGKSQRNRRFLGVLSLVTFFPQGKKVIKNIFPGRVVAGRVYVHLNLLAHRQTAAHNARGRMLSSSTTFGGPPSPLGKANKPPRGGGDIGLKVTFSATISTAPGAARSECLYRAFAKCIFSIGTRREVQSAEL